MSERLVNQGDSEPIDTTGLAFPPHSYAGKCLVEPEDLPWVSMVRHTVVLGSRRRYCPITRGFLLLVVEKNSLALQLLLRLIHDPNVHARVFHTGSGKDNIATTTCSLRKFTMSDDNIWLCDQPLKILVIGSTYPRDEDDYAVPWMREAHAQLTKRGHDITVLAPTYKGLKSHEIDGITVKRFRYAPKPWERLTHEEGAPNKINNPLMQLLAIPYVIAGCIAAFWLARKEKFDAIHVHWPFPHEPMGWCASRACGAPLVIMSHGAEFALARRKPWVASLLRRSLRKGDLLIANSRDTAKQIRDLSGCEALVLPYGTTVHPKNEPPKENPRPRVLFTGRLIQRKGVEYLLQAIPAILEQEDVDFVITGSGDQRTKLEEIRDRLNLQDRVSFLGFVSNEQLNEEYARCDVWVNPSVIDDRGDTEGLGVGSIEAYAHRKPVIASAVGGIPDTVVNGETGYLVPEKDPQALTTAILDLIQNPEKAKRFGNAGLEFASVAFNWERISDRLEDTYYALLGVAGVAAQTDTQTEDYLNELTETGIIRTAA